MATTTRYRVRTATKTFASAGPDLLRTRANARRQLSADMGQEHFGWYFRLEDGKWSDKVSKNDALLRFDTWKSKLDLVFGREDSKTKKVVPKIITRREDVSLIPTPDCSAKVILGRSLIEHQYPRVQFAGGYVYKQIAGSSSWSDHAWGDAIDMTENPPEPTNDETFDWTTRMAASGNMDYDYALGSRKGRVVQSSAPDFKVVPSSAASSHLWHVHISFVDHHGQRPPHTGGH